MDTQGGGGCNLQRIAKSFAVLLQYQRLMDSKEQVAQVWQSTFKVDSSHLAFVYRHPPSLCPIKPPKRSLFCLLLQILYNGDWRPVTLSALEKAPQIELNENLTLATSKKGYRMVILQLL